MDDWDALRGPLEAACEEPEDEAAIRRAIEAAERVASAAGEPPDELSDHDRDWVERHGVPPDDLVDLAVLSMKKVATANAWWHDRLNDLRYRLGDIAAP